jgi:hypothetical protein
MASGIHETRIFGPRRSSISITTSVHCSAGPNWNPCIHINPEAFGLTYFRRHPVGEFPLDSQHRLGDVLSKVRLPRVRNLWLSAISATESDLGRFYAGIGGGVRDIYMNSIHLTEGSWMRTLDSLRDHVQCSTCETRPTIKLVSLAGGEYEALRKRVGLQAS